MNRRRMIRLALVAVALSVAWLAVPAQAGAAHGSKPSLRVPLPAAGHIGIELLEIKATGRRRNKLPARLRLKAKNAAALPPSVRVLYARRKIRHKRSTSYALLLLSVNAAAPKAAAAGRARTAGDDNGGKLLDTGQKPKQDDLTAYAYMALLFGSPAAAQYIQQEEEARQKAEALGLDYDAAAYDDIDLAPGPVKDANADLTKLFSGGTAGPLVFGNGSADPTLDTGHFDDGHAFGWKVTSEQDELKVFSDLSGVLQGQYAQVIADLERDMAADINGDGAIAAPVTPGQSIGTVVGPPVIKN